MNHFAKSLELQEKFHHLIPGGSHTYAKGDDQYPEFCPPYITHARGCKLWDVDKNEYIEYGNGLRAVGLGHAFEPVIEAAAAQMKLGTNFNRPSTIELECAEKMLEIVGGDMVKFAKNGSDITTAAIKLSRAYTGREKIAMCSNHPFFSIDDWFMSTTPLDAGIPKYVHDLNLTFRYNHIEDLEKLFAEYPDQIACVILEPEKQEPMQDEFLFKVKELCHQNSTIFILDEMITGFRWAIGGGQTYFGIEPDLSCFGKAMGNGFAVSALVGKRELMDLGGLYHKKERVFLLSTTHGAETHSLAAAMATIDFYQNNPVIEHFKAQGTYLEKGINQSIEEFHLQPYFETIGHPFCMVYGTKDQNRTRSQPFRTLFIQETIKRGVIAPSLILTYSHKKREIDQTLDVIHEALAVYRKAIDEGIEKYLEGRPVQPVYRKYN